MADLERGKRIRDLRKKKAERLGRKVTQPQMAEATGVSLRAAQEWEYGGGIDDENLPALLEFLETDADYLLRGKNHALDLSATEEQKIRDLLTRMEKKLDETLRRLDERS